MQPETRFTRRDREQLDEAGIDLRQAEQQISRLRRPPSPTRLDRACRVEDGIEQIADQDHERLVDLWGELVDRSQVVKFVPASGAATRMFRDLRSYLADGSCSDAAKRFSAALDRFAFHDALLERLGATANSESPSIDALEPILTTLLSPNGLGFEMLPKGLIPFHRYEKGSRTALAEHLFEGYGYLSHSRSKARFHFTVSDGSRSMFADHIATVSPEVEAQFGGRVEAEFSTQSRSTDTLAIDSSGEPFRLAGGELLLRPSGHGALIGNLEALDADVVFIKNIDNIAPKRFHSTTVLWKRLLAGRFVELRNEVFALADALEADPRDDSIVEDALESLHQNFSVQPPLAVVAGDLATKSEWVSERLNRPIRVAGMVPNKREPGGGPFWVANPDGSLTAQIVEGSQVDRTNDEQTAIWNTATHLNPVDLVCGLVDRHGHRYRLSEFIDYDMAFVARKSHGGQTLSALERPGLWNGSMAGWNTAFVEVPLSTFTPVKTIFDLLRPEHQPE